MMGRTETAVTLRESPMHPSLRDVLSKGRWVAMPMKPMQIARTAAWLQSHGVTRR